MQVLQLTAVKPFEGVFSVGRPDRATHFYYINYKSFDFYNRIYQKKKGGMIYCNSRTLACKVQAERRNRIRRKPGQNDGAGIS